ncbi:MAG: hypothetical protein ABIH53_00070, partial [archaeon]
QGPSGDPIGWVFKQTPATEAIPKSSTGQPTTTSHINYCHEAKITKDEVTTGEDYYVLTITQSEPYPWNSDKCIITGEEYQDYTMQDIRPGAEMILTSQPTESMSDYLKRMKVENILNAEEGSYVKVVRCRVETALSSVAHNFLLAADSCPSGVFIEEGTVGYAFDYNWGEELNIQDYADVVPLRPQGPSGDPIGWVFKQTPATIPEDSRGQPVSVLDFEYCDEAIIVSTGLTVGYTARKITAAKPYPWSSCELSITSYTKYWTLSIQGNAPQGIDAGSTVTNVMGIILTSPPTESPKQYLLRLPDFVQTDQNGGGSDSGALDQTDVTPTLEGCVDDTYGPTSSAAPPTWPPNIESSLTAAQARGHILSFESKIQSIICKNKCLRPQSAQQDLLFISNNCEQLSTLTPATPSNMACIDDGYESQLKQQQLLLKHQKWPLPEVMPGEPSDSQIISRIQSSKAMVQDIICRNSCLREEVGDEFVEANCKSTATAGTHPAGTSIPDAASIPAALTSVAQEKVIVPGAFTPKQSPIASFIGMVTGRVVSLLR